MLHVGVNGLSTNKSQSFHKGPTILMLLEALLVFRVHCTVVISIKNDDMLNNGFL